MFNLVAIDHLDSWQWRWLWIERHFLKLKHETTHVSNCLSRLSKHDLSKLIRSREGTNLTTTARFGGLRQAPINNITFSCLIILKRKTLRQKKEIDKPELPWTLSKLETLSSPVTETLFFINQCFVCQVFCFFYFIFINFFYLASPQGQGHHNSVNQLLWAPIT